MFSSKEERVIENNLEIVRQQKEIEVLKNRIGKMPQVMQER